MPFADALAGHGYIVRLGSRLLYKRRGAAGLDADDS